MGIFRHRQGSINAIVQPQKGKYYITPNRRRTTDFVLLKESSDNLLLENGVDRYRLES